MVPMVGGTTGTVNDTVGQTTTRPTRLGWRKLGSEPPNYYFAIQKGSRVGVLFTCMTSSWEAAEKLAHEGTLTEGRFGSQAVIFGAFATPYQRSLVQCSYGGTTIPYILPYHTYCLPRVLLAVHHHHHHHGVHNDTLNNTTAYPCRWNTTTKTNTTTDLRCRPNKGSSRIPTRIRCADALPECCFVVVACFCQLTHTHTHLSLTHTRTNTDSCHDVHRQSLGLRGKR